MWRWQICKFRILTVPAVIGSAPQRQGGVGEKNGRKKNVELAEIEALRITLDNHPDRTTTTTLSRLLCSMWGATRSKGTDESGLLSHSKICEIERYVEEKRS